MKKTAIVLSFPLMFFVQCAGLPIQSPSGKDRVVLAAQESKCAPEKSYGQWSLLFGAIPLNRPVVAFANPSKTYRITEHSSTFDIFVDVLGGSFTTLTRRTITVNACEESFALASQEQLDAQQLKQTQSALDEYLTQPSGITNEPIFIMKGGETRRGRILEISDSQITIMERKKSDKIEITTADSEKRVAKILMRDGSTVVGEVLDQTPIVITIKSDKGNVQLAKSKIRRISYTTVADLKKEAKESKQETLEQATLDRREVQRIILAAELAK
ncbi:MAG: hypothetical protein K8S54_09260 [Spirochaetia bacterium]|nr:hypothetical protein [Spirochaetia bacterium]